LMFGKHAIARAQPPGWRGGAVTELHEGPSAKRVLHVQAGWC